MQIIVLGAAAGGGFPQWNCRCENSQKAWDGRARRRTQSSVAVSSDGSNWLLINASPDFRQQVLATPQLWPRHGLRDSPIKAVLLTSAEVDHVAGLLSMRERHPFALLATASTLRALDDNPIFSVMHSDCVTRTHLVLGEPQSLPAPLQRIDVTPFAVPGKIPLYLEHTVDDPFNASEGQAIGLKVSSGEKCFYYIPGCAALTPALGQMLKGAPVVLFDGTLWTDSELSDSGVGHKSGQRMGHISISGSDGTLEAFSALDVQRKIFIHINTTNPILDDASPQHAEVLQRGWEIAYDGQEITL